MQSKATTVERYLAELPPERRAAVRAVRETILANLGDGYEEGMQYGMIGYYVPHSVFPAGYHCDPRQPLPFAGLASQKNHMSLYLMSVYAEPAEEAWLRAQFAKAQKKLDMGKCCIRFKKLEDLPLAVIGKAIRRIPAKKHVAHYEATLAAARAAAETRKRSKTAGKGAGTGRKAARGAKAPARAGEAARKTKTVRKKR